MRREEPKYISLANWIREQIETGALAHNEKLGTEIEYARQFGVSRNTVRHAIGLLEKEGFVVSRHGSGTYVEGRSQKKKSMVVGYITPAEIVGEGLCRMEQVLRKAGYTLRFSSTGNRWDNEREVLQQYLEMPVDGLLVEATKSARPNPNLDLYDKLGQKGMPMVFLGDAYPGLEAAVRIAADGYEKGKQAVKYLAGRGLQKIGGIFLGDCMEGVEQYRGFSQAMIENGVHLQDDLICWMDSDKVRLLLHTRWDIEDRAEWAGCDAIVCCSDTVAVCILNQLVRKNIRVPEDIHLVSLQKELYGGLCLIPITRISSSKLLMAETAAQKLMCMMDGVREKSVVLPVEVLERSPILQG